MNNMTTPTPATELMSALADGHLNTEEFAAVLEACQIDESLLTRWNAYHVIGDVLRSSAPVMRGAGVVSLGQFKRRLAPEAMAAGSAYPVEIGVSAHVGAKQAGDSAHVGKPAANDGNFRWKMVAGFASLTAISAITWSAFGSLAPTGAPQLARSPGPEQVLVASPQGPMVRDARLEELLAAHRQLGTASALQMPSGFLRDATFDLPQNAER